MATLTHLYLPIHKLKGSISFIGIFILVFFSVNAQERCGTVDYQKQMREAGLLKESDAEFERWLKENIQLYKGQPKDKRTLTKSYKIQVVVHVIHKGESIGVESNISDAQVMSQIEVLNKDFNRQNTDAANTPPEFQGLAGNMPIEFVLANTDPNGLPSSGIVRVRGSRNFYTIQNNDLLKSESYWPAENYLNIWVCYLTDRYGYTQFPISTLPGLENSSKNRLTDGIVIAYNVFGSSDYGNFNLHNRYNKGRTTTHEMGHFFGLRHLWGDEPECKGDDYVDDTPQQANETTDCPTHPQKECPADNPQPKMFQNFLDYTDDACMNLFTLGQMERMITVLENSPRRASLLLPLASIPPEVQFPKIFSPNGDGINDYWLWTNTLDFQGCKLSIYNRFGQLVYDATSYDNTWDGRSSSGQPLEEEAYYYIISCENQKEITGGVRIVR